MKDKHSTQIIGNNACCNLLSNAKHSDNPGNPKNSEDEDKGTTEASQQGDQREIILSTSLLSFIKKSNKGGTEITCSQLAEDNDIIEGSVKLTELEALQR
jgi:hypothetical protein